MAREIPQLVEYVRHSIETKKKYRNKESSDSYGIRFIPLHNLPIAFPSINRSVTTAMSTSEQER